VVNFAYSFLPALL